MATENCSVDLFMIEDIDVKKNRIFLGNYVFDKKRVYMGSSEEIAFYYKAFHEALDRNIFLFVEYDDDRGIILQQ